VHSAFLTASRKAILATAISLIALIAFADGAAGNRAPWGFLYVFPMMIAAVKLRPAAIVVLAVFCSTLGTLFDTPGPEPEAFLRFLFALLVYAGSGLLVIAIVRNSREQGLCREVEQQLRILFDSSPAAILTLDSAGIIREANNASRGLLMIPRDESLKGKPIREYLPMLADALQFDPGPDGLRTAAQCQGLRANGEIFQANTWFSTWTAPDGKHLAAIVADSSEDMRDREEESLRQMLQANRLGAAAISHEVRNLCSAISVVSGNLRDKHDMASDDDMQALRSLVSGLERIASMQLSAGSGDCLEEVPLQTVLDDLRIVIEPQWREIGGAVRWSLPNRMPGVLGERHGLLQVFLNLAQNSCRAVQDGDLRELSIAVTAVGESVSVSFSDSGPGVSSPENLFVPFQPGADGAGIGLSVSRAMVRGYGGDLRWKPCPAGSCFAVELQAVQKGRR
jgi:two-component system, LuxR family, sensor kinase FixL